MLKAYLHRKVPRELVRREDVLTSCVFGTLEAAGEEGRDLASCFLALARYRGTARATGGSLRSVSYEFWPWLECPHASAEPDVLLTLEHETSRSLVAIEAKLDSGKSSFASESGIVRDQLAREWIALLDAAKQRGITDCTLVYLTADVGPPADIDESLAELVLKHPDVGADARIAWLSWRDLPDLITADHGVALLDLRRFLLKEHLGYFAGFRSPPVLAPAWVFTATHAAPADNVIWAWPSPAALPERFCFGAAPSTQFHWPAFTLSSNTWSFDS